MNIKSYIPQVWLKRARPWYHGLISHLGNLRYGRPSESMRVIGITGTKGKSSTVYILYHLLTDLGIKVGVSSSVYFSDGVTLTKNDLRNSMPGRFTLHQLMARARDNGCSVFIIEVTSEGLAQNRHRGIHFDGVAITNLYPEHLESHGGFESYKQAKGRLFTSLARSRAKVVNGESIEPLVVINRDDRYAGYYRKLANRNTVSVGIHTNKSVNLKADKVKVGDHGVQFELVLSKTHYPAKIPLLGEFNVINSMMALAFGHWLGLEYSSMISSLAHIRDIPGRMNVVSDNPRIIVDYAHIPEALEYVYRTLRDTMPRGSKMIAVLGSCGGGRDVWKRSPMGKMAATWNDYVIVTDEDPYDEDPQAIIDQVFKGVEEGGKEEEKDAFRVLSRRDALQKALSLARSQDTIIVTGKGSENSIMRAHGKRESWNDEIEMKKLLVKR